ncbi:MAG: homoserine kinase [Streptosporangiaceae bacterium]
MNWPVEPVRVRVPATSANLGPGFDALGLALGLHDLVIVSVTERGLSIKVTGVGEDAARYGEDHLVVRAMRAGFDAIGARPPGLALACENAIPQGFGLGSSAAAIVAGLVAARVLCGPAGVERLPDSRALALATEIEGHADNAAACLAGGLTIAWSSQAGAAGFVRLEPMAALTPVLCVPAKPLSTRAARAVLPGAVPHGDAAANSARSALLVTALAGVGQAGAGRAPDRQTLLDATEDFLHQRYRAAAMPATVALVTALRAAGIPAVISGAGPAVLALTVPGVTAGPDEVAAIAAGQGTDWQARTLTVDRDGATVLG